MRTGVLLVAVAAAAGVAPAQTRKAADIPDSVVVERAIPYLGADRAETADLYRPKDTPAGAKRPAVLIIHGGGWTGGDKGATREINIGTTLALNGYVGLSVNYALATKTKATWPQNLHDCKTAVRWLRKNAVTSAANSWPRFSIVTFARALGRWLCRGFLARRSHQRCGRLAGGHAGRRHRQARRSVLARNLDRNVDRHRPRLRLEHQRKADDAGDHQHGRAHQATAGARARHRDLVARFERPRRGIGSVRAAPEERQQTHAVRQVR